MRKTNLQSIYLLLLFGSLAAALTGCAKTGMYSTNTATAVSYLTVMNLAPYGDSADIYLGGTKYPGTPYPVGVYSTAYFKVASGSYDVQFKTPTSDSLLASIPSSAFDSLGLYTLILYNDSTNSVVKAAKIKDNLSNVRPDSAYFRFFNMSPDMPAVDLYINNTKVQANRTPADNILNSLFNNFQSFPNGYYTIEVRQAGTNNTVGTPLNGSLLQGQIYTIFLEELHKSSGNSFGLFVLQGAQ
jgi:hypothetical protein